MRVRLNSVVQCVHFDIKKAPSVQHVHAKFFSLRGCGGGVQSLVNYIFFKGGGLLITVGFIYILCLVSVCLLMFFLYSINVKTAEPIGPKLCVGPRMTLRKVY